MLPFVEEVHVDKMESKVNESEIEKIEVSINKPGNNYQGIDH